MATCKSGKMLSMDEGIKQLLLSFVGSGLGAMVSGYFGVVFGFNQIKRQKAFEKRVEWYQSTVQMMNVLIDNTNIKALSPISNMAASKELIDAVYKFKQLTSDVELYGSESAIIAIREMWVGLDKLAPKLTAAGTDREAKIPIATKAAIDSTVYIQHAKSVLVSDTRNLLGLKDFSS